MRLSAVAVTLLMLLLGPLGARADTAGSVRDVITRQMEAFAHGDAPAAFAFAAPGIQSMFGDAGSFMAMVRRSYAPVFQPRSVDFGALQEEGGSVVQLVELIGPDGLAYTARYTLEREADGSWRISACELVPSRRLGV